MRDVARDTLAKITVSLGSRYLLFVLKELRSSLTRGYQVNSNYSKLPPFATSLLDERKYKYECLNDSYDRDNVKRATGLMSKTTPDATRAFLCRHCTTSSEENLSSIDYVCLGPPRSCFGGWIVLLTLCLQVKCYFFMRLPNSRKRLILIYLQLHVLSYTLHTLLDKMSESLLPGDLDSSLQGLVEVSCLFIFFLLWISSPSLENLSSPCYVVDKFLQRPHHWQGR